MLEQKAFSAVLWSGADVFMRTSLTFVVSIALARMLTPEEFGTVALLYLFTGIATAFVDCGFSAALMQKQDTTHDDESTVFWFNLGIGAITTILLWQSATLIANFYEQPILVPLTKVSAVNIFVSAMSSIHATLLTKRLDFKTPMHIGVIATFISGALSVYLAGRGFGAWAIVAQTLVSSAIATALFWYLNSWRPRFVFSFASARQLLGFGGYLFAAGLLDVVYNRVYSLLIGKFFGVRDLGFYSRADSTNQLPVSVLAGIMSRVAFPIFSAANDDKEKLRRGVRIALQGMMLINIPTMLGLRVVADPLVSVLFGERWEPAVPILQILCLGAVLWPLHVINLNVLMAQGHSNLFFRLEIIKKSLGSLLLIGGSFFGVKGIAWSTVIFGGLGFLINAHYTGKHLGYGAIKQTIDFLPSLLIGGAMAAVVSGIGIFLDWPDAQKLVFLVSAGVCVFATTNVVFRTSALRVVLKLLQNRQSIP